MSGVSRRRVSRGRSAGAWAVCALVAVAGVLVVTSPKAYVRSRTEGGIPISWDDACIVFYLNEAGASAVTFDDTRSEVLESFQTWSEVDCADMTFVYGGSTNDDFVGFRNGGPNANVLVWRNTVDDWEHPPGVIGLTTVTFCSEAKGAGCYRAGLILDADIEFNGGEFEFTVTDTRRRVRYDVQNTVTHELGHVIGFDHTPVPQATMYASAPKGEVSKRTLHDDDIEGLCEVYPMPVSDGGAPEPCSVPDGGFVAPPASSSGSSNGCHVAPASAPTGAAPLLLLVAPALCRRRRR